MAMYDNVICDMPLPDGYTPDCQDFQTKFFDCELETYRITKDGKLIRYLFGRDLEYSDGDIVDFHGVFNFYDLNTKSKKWYEYDAKFLDGQCISIKKSRRHFDL